jgi:predicted anti-sigma-YlaC factor YlaD
MATNEQGKHDMGRPVSRWKDGELSPAEAARVEAHLADCPDCRAAADVIDAVRAHLGEWTAPEAPADLPERVLKGIQARAANILSMKSHLRMTAVAASILLVASLAVWPFVNGGATPVTGRPEPIADVALDEMMHEIAMDNLSGRAVEEEDR